MSRKHEKVCKWKNYKDKTCFICNLLEYFIVLTGAQKAFPTMIILYLAAIWTDYTKGE